MAYTFPDSSAPSTPESRPAKRRSNLFADLASGPSTTPAGPPPSSAASFTPAEPPPSTVFGSSHLGQQQSLFGSRARNDSPQSQGLFSANGSATKSKFPFGVDKDLHPPSASKIGKPQRFEFAINDDDGDADASGEDEEPELPPNQVEYGSDEDMDIGGDIWQEQATAGKNHDAYDWTRESDLLIRSSPQQAMRSSKRPRPGGGQSLRPRESRHKAQGTVVRRKKSVIPTIASDTAKQLGLPELTEPDLLILETEREIRKLYPDDNDTMDKDDRVEAALQIVPDALARTWQRCCNQHNSQKSTHGDLVIGVGPPEDAPGFHKAAFMANLLLKLHHPPLARIRQALMSFRSTGRLGNSLQAAAGQPSEPYPEVLFNWLEEYHYPFRHVIASLKTYQPNPTAHQNFWDFILSLTLRGRLVEAISILEEADFTKAYTASEDGSTGVGYSGPMLQLTLKEVNRAIEILRSCPTVTDGDFDTGDFAWATFRTKTAKAAEQLSQATEDPDEIGAGSAFNASAFSARSSLSDFGRSSRRERKYPKAVYRPLQELYGILLGQTDELLAASQDWVEASIALTAWWDGEELEFSQSISSRPSMRLIDSNPGAAYRNRLAYAFDRVAGEESGKDDTLQLDSSNPVEVGLAAVFEGATDEALRLIRAFSIPIASAVVEIACIGGWYESPPSSTGGAGFNQDDMMVLNYGQSEDNLNRDDLLLLYADMLSDVQELQEPNAEQKEGWAVAVEILNRLDNAKAGEQRIGELMSKLTVDSDEQADSLVQASRTYGLDEQAHKIAERYGDLLAETTSDYGKAIVYYARAHRPKKVKDVLDLLISYCLVESAAFPPAAELDDHLRYLLDKPRDTLQHMRRNDPVAADILSLSMSGYATLRRFYEMRDQGLVVSASSSASILRPLARKKAAAAALVAVVASSADAIRGGLFDRESEAVVCVDGLLVLLGEAMPLVDSPKRLFTLPQLLVLLRAVEDVQTVHPRVRAQCDECLRAALVAGRAGGQGQKLPDPQALMKKSINALGNGPGTGFSLLGSIMADQRRGGTGERETRREEVRRGWDWRKGLSAEQGGDDIINLLRHGLANEVARAWLDGEEL